MLSFLIKPLEDNDLKTLENFLTNQNLGYPNYEKWIKKTCLPELYFGEKKGYCVRVNENNAIVANIIFQQHKQLPKTLEIKNLRVDNKLRRRDIAHFLMKQAEVQAISKNNELIILDFRAEIKNYSREILNFLLFCGYEILYKTELYHPGVDFVMIKKLKQQN